MRKIKLSRGLYAFVDASDFDLVSKHKWYALRNKNTWYATRPAPKKNGKRKTIYMHRFLLDVPKGLVTDHINGNGLDCRRVNMRICTHKQNMCNQHLRKDNTSGYKGVWWDKAHQVWRSAITVNTKRITLGSYDNPEKAAQAYDEAAIRYHGEFARINGFDESNRI